MPSFKKPTPQQIETAVQRMRSPEFAAYFLSRLQNPLWVRPLMEKGLFSSPPPPFQMDGGRFAFPHWPASDYLARMAQHVPTDVALAFAELKTDNVFVMGHIIAAALAMPAETSALLVPAVSRAAADGKLWIHLEDAGALCVHLAKGGQVQAALNLAEALFAPKQEEGQKKPRSLDEHWYTAALREVVPVLVGREPKKFLSRLCEWLKLGIDATKRVNPDTGGDYSYLWRPAIEEHGQNRGHGFVGIIVGFARAGFEKAIKDGDLTFEDALAILEGYRYLIFARIRIHLINEFAEKSPGLTRRTILDRQLLSDFQYKHEYAMLIGRRFYLLTEEERGTWFAWVDAGPNMANFNETFRENMGREATDEDRQNRKKHWQFEKYHCVRKHLGDSQRILYEAMLAKHGEPELAYFNAYTSAGAWGAVSPMTVDDLARLTFEETVEKVSSWQPGEHRLMGPDKEGLSNTFGQYIAGNPEVLSRRAETLIGRPAIYVRTFLTQMAEAVKAGREIDVPEVLKLSRWVLEQPLEKRTMPEQEGDALVDRDWQWTRDEISRFVQNVCEAEAGNVPRYPLEGLRDQIWQIVNDLSCDRAKSEIVHDTSKDDPRIQDYLILGINSSRGKAVEAALEYSRWVANHLKRREGEGEVVLDGFEAMPEVREMLEWQIAADNRTLEALTVIGSRIDLIYWIDRAWLATHSVRLFNLHGIKELPPSAHGWAAWNAFLVWVRPHIEFFRLFKAQYAYAVEQSKQVVSIAEQPDESPMHHLGEHLMLLYAWGQLNLDNDDGLLRHFLNASHPDIRRHAFEFVGRVLQDEEKLPAEMIGRFMTLWDVYWAGQGKQDIQQKQGSWLFGMWFSSGQFPEQWALERLEDFIEANPTPEPEHAIVKQLEIIAPVDIGKVVRILDRLVHSDREGWRIQGWLNSMRKILEMAMKAGGDARRQAVQTIDFLGRRGHTSFGELLGLGSTYE